MGVEISAKTRLFTREMRLGGVEFSEPDQRSLSWSLLGNVLRVFSPLPASCLIGVAFLPVVLLQLRSSLDKSK